MTSFNRLDAAGRHPGGAAAVQCRFQHRREILPQASARCGCASTASRRSRSTATPARSTPARPTSSAGYWRITLDEIGDRVPVVAGVYADGSLEAARLARIAETGGAACLLVFPPQSMAMGGQLRPEMAVTHFATIAAATSLPLICFNYPLSGGLGYPHETLLRLVEAVPSIRAIKDWSGDVMAHERNIRALQGLPRPVTVLTTHSAWPDELAGPRLQRALVRRRQCHRRSAGGAVPRGSGQRSRCGTGDQRPDLPVGAGLLRAASSSTCTTA